MQPKGLKDIDLVESGEGQYDVKFTASPAETGAKVKTAKTNEEKADVRAVTHVKFVELPDMSRYRRTRVLERDGNGKPIPGGKMVEIRGNIGIAGGIINEPVAYGPYRDEAEEQDSKKTLEVRTYSGVVLPKGGSNQSHAEHLFAEWAEDSDSARPGKPIGKIAEVDLRLDGEYTPCSGCAYDLNRIATLLKGRNKDVQLRIDYSAVKQLHRDWKDDSECQAAIGANWEIRGLTAAENAAVEVKLAT
jgi:hypothetical protein